MQQFRPRGVKRGFLGGQDGVHAVKGWAQSRGQWADGAGFGQGKDGIGRVLKLFAGDIAKVDIFQGQATFGHQIVKAGALVKPSLGRKGCGFVGVDQPFDKALFGDHEFGKARVIGLLHLFLGHFHRGRERFGQEGRVFDALCLGAGVSGDIGVVMGLNFGWGRCGKRGVQRSVVKHQKAEAALFARVSDQRIGERRGRNHATRHSPGQERARYVAAQVGLKGGLVGAVLLQGQGIGLAVKGAADALEGRDFAKFCGHRGIPDREAQPGSLIVEGGAVDQACQHLAVNAEAACIGHGHRGAKLPRQGVDLALHFAGIVIRFNLDLADAADLGRRAAEVFNPKAAEARDQHGDQNPDHKASATLLFARGVVVIGGLRRF